MIRIQVRPNEPLESALRRFKRQCNYAGIFRLAKKYNFFEKRSDSERRERRERIRTMQRAQRRLLGPSKVRRSSRKTKSRGGRDSSDELDGRSITSVPAVGTEFVKPEFAKPAAEEEAKTSVDVQSLVTPPVGSEGTGAEGGAANS